MGRPCNTPMLMRHRIVNSTFFTREQVCEFLDLAEKSFGTFNSMERKDRAALQYFMREFMYVPMTYIAEVLGRKPWHVNQTIERMRIAANESRLPVTMNAFYRESIEILDDMCRDHFGYKNMEMSSINDESELAFVIWNGMKACDCFEENGLDESQKSLANELLATIGMETDGWMSDMIVENFTLQRNDVSDT